MKNEAIAQLQLPDLADEPIWEQHIHTMATMNIPAIPGQAITLRLVADLHHFSRHGFPSNQSS